MSLNGVKIFQIFLKILLFVVFIWAYGVGFAVMGMTGSFMSNPNNIYAWISGALAVFGIVNLVCLFINNRLARMINFFSTVLFAIGCLVLNIQWTEHYEFLPWASGIVAGALTIWATYYLMKKQHN